MSSPQNRKKIRQIEHLETVEEKIYVFCEGEQTEPLYFKGFEKSIKSDAIYKNSVYVHIEGIGADTLRVIYAAEKYVNENRIKDASIWCVYDKDSFPKDDFNAVAKYAEKLNETQNDVKYKVAWSNQCIEYWFILHFDYYTSDNDRKYYREYLHRKFKKLGWDRYQKNNSELFTIMTEKGNPKQAIAWAKKRILEFMGKTDSDSAPATKVYLLVEELARYLPESIKHKYM